MYPLFHEILEFCENIRKKDFAKFLRCSYFREINDIFINPQIACFTMMYNFIHT